MTVLSGLDAAGRRRSPATLPGCYAGRRRVRAMIVVLWRAGLRVQEALALASTTSTAGAARCWSATARGGRRREVGMDDWGWEQLRPWLNGRAERRSGRCCASSTAPRAGGRGRAPPSAPSSAGSPPRRGQAPLCGAQLRHAHALELAP
jgi:hypothetical protein